VTKSCDLFVTTSRHSSIFQQPRNEEGKRVEKFAIKRQEDFFMGLENKTIILNPFYFWEGE